MRHGLAALAVVVAAACSSENELAIDLRTDFDPGRELVGVRTEAWRGSDPRETGGRPTEREEITALTTSDFVAGRRVAEIGDVEPGRWWVRVSLLRADGSVLGSRLASLDVCG